MVAMRRVVRTLAILAVPMAGLLLGGSEAQAGGHGHGGHNNHGGHGGHNNHGGYHGHGNFGGGHHGGFGHGFHGGFGGGYGYQGGFGGFGYGYGYGGHQAPFCGRCHHRHFGGCH